MTGIEWIKAASVFGAGLSVGFAAIGAAIGEGYTAGKANETLSFRPNLVGEILKTMLVGQAVSQSTAIYAMVVALVLIFVV